MEALRPEVIARAVEKAMDKVRHARSHYATRKAEVESELKAVQGRIDRLVAAIADGLAVDDIRARLSAENARKAKLTADLERLTQVAALSAFDLDEVRAQLQARAGDVVGTLGRQTVAARQMLRKVLADPIDWSRWAPGASGATSSGAPSLSSG